MKLFPIYIDGDITLAEVSDIFRAAGWHVRISGTQIIAARVPAFLRRDTIAAHSNVTRLPARPHIKRAAR